MSIFKYFTSLIPSLEKRTILEDINNSLGEMKVSTMPILVKTQQPMGTNTYKFKDKDIEAFNRKFQRDNKTGHKGNFIAVSLEVAKSIEDNGPNLIKVVEVLFSHGVVASAITYKKAAVLKYIEAMSFFQKYIRRAINNTYVLELASLDGSVGADSLSAGEVKWLKENEDNFIACLAGLSMKATAFDKALEETPDTIISPEASNVINQISGGKTDPFKMNFISAWMNPIFHVRMKIADWQNAKYELALQERKTIELKILQLKNKLEGKQDAKLEQMVEYNMARLEKLNYKIKKMEEAYE